MLAGRRRWLVVLAAAPFAMAGCATALPEPSAVERTPLAPTGTLRVGVYPGTPTSLVRERATGEPRGVVHDLGKAVAPRLGVGFELVEFRPLPEVLAALQAGRVDLAGTNATPARAAVMDFSRTVLEIELGYLVAADSGLARADDVTRPGTRVGVTQGSTSQTLLPRLLPAAVVVAVPSVSAGADALRERRIDAYATNKAIPFELSDGLPGSRVLDGRWGVETWALAIPQGRAAGLAWLDAYLAQAKPAGLVARAVERSGLRGASVASARGS